MVLVDDRDARLRVALDLALGGLELEEPEPEDDELLCALAAGLPRLAAAAAQL